MKVNILGVKIDNLTKDEVLGQVDQFLSYGKQYCITTPNPEMVVATQKDNEFLKILNKADLAVPDGFGLILASRYLGRHLPERIAGVDLMLDICKIAEQNNCSIYLLGGDEGVASRAAEKIKEKFPRLKIAGAESGGVIDIKNLSTDNQKINSARPDILFVALGAEKQEKWIAQNLKNVPSVKIAMGVGGAFDFIAEKIKRAPRWIQKIGLEWLWRLSRQPRRWKRILTATLKFSYLIIRKGKKYA